MTAILFDHTESYYIDYCHVLQYSWYVVDVIAAFFFISGYLFYKQQGFSLRHKLLSITRSLVLPYFIFTAAMALPKALVHGNSTEISHILTDIFTGQASWFISSLVVAEFYFSFVLWLSRGIKAAVIPLLILPLIALVIAFPILENNFWHYQEAAICSIFILSGWLYSQYEDRFKWLSKTYITVFLTVIFVGLKFLEYYLEADLIVSPVKIYPYWLFFIDTFTGIAIVISIAKHINKNRLMEWVGRRSIVYYFLCGGIPWCTAWVMNRLSFPYDEQYWRVVIVFILNFVITSAAVHLIYKYIPFITGRRLNG